VDNTFRVCHLEHFTQLAQEPSNPLRTEPDVALEERIERYTADVLHDYARSLRIIEGGIIERDGVWVLEASHQQHFALKSLGEFGIRGQVLVHHLDDDLALKIDLPGKIDLAHAAFAQEAHGLIPAQKDAAHHEGNP